MPSLCCRRKASQSRVLCGQRNRMRGRQCSYRRGIRTSPHGKCECCRANCGGNAVPYGGLQAKSVFGREHHRDPERPRSEEHTSELQSLRHLVCRLLLEKKK